MFERLTEGLSRAFERVRGRDPEAARAEFLAAIRDRLLEADAHPQVVDRLLERLSARLSRPDDDPSLAPSLKFLKGLEAEVTHILGERTEPLRLKSAGTSAIMVVGLQGTGKTTSVGKLARALAAEGKRVMLVPLDVKRPAAIEQLRVLGGQVGVPVWATPANAKPVKEARAALKQAERDGVDVVLFDTAGRLAIDRELMGELGDLRDELRPQEILYVMDAMAGQSALATAEAFVAAARPTGIVLTKVDADPRGGAVLSVRARTNLPIKWMGVGEKLAAFEPFDPARVAARLLDLGDLTGLAQTFDKAVDQDDAERLAQRMMSAKFNLEDFAKQLEMMGKMGSMESVLGMLPGGKGMVKAVQGQMGAAEQDLKRTLAVIRSMTPLERRNPKLIDKSNSRKKRIAMGSGASLNDVNKVLKRYEQMQKMMKQLSRTPIAALKQLLGGGLPGGFPGGGFPGGMPPGGGFRR